MTKPLAFFVWTIFLLFAYHLPLYAQTTGTQAPTVSTTSTSILSAASQNKPGSLYSDFVLQDIETSRIEELSQWAIQLGLSSKGGIAELRAKLVDYYRNLQKEAQDLKAAEAGVDAAIIGSTTIPVPNNQENSTARAEKNISIKIERSGSAEYFSMESTGDDLVRLSSGVSLVLRDNADGLEHKISADEITINRKTKELNARGQVVYQQGTQTFTGEEMLFFPDNQNTIFIDATGERGQSLSGATATFRIKGHVLNRLLKEIIVLEDAYLSSSKVNPDAYRITANKIWILSSGEWAIDSMILYVGNIPVFYFPFFYMPPDELVFHPAIGTKSIEGWSLQTTWYIFGKKPESKKPLSFLNLDFDDNKDYDLVPRGLFLKRVPKKNTLAASQANSQPGSQLVASNLKFMLDYYTRLGFFVGMNLNSKGDVFSTLDIDLGFAFSRRIFAGPGGYTSFYQDPNTLEFKEYWDKGYFAGQELPFRYFLDVRTGIVIKGLNNATISVNLPLRSDPYVIDDFLKGRAEDIDWQGLLNIDTTTVELASTPLQISNSDPVFKISSTTLDIPVAGLNPIVNKLSINSPELNWAWKQISVPSAEIDPEILASYNPTEAAFYAPSLLTLPSFSLTLAGKLLKLPYQKPLPVLDSSKREAVPYLAPGKSFADLGTAIDATSESGAQSQISASQEDLSEQNDEKLDKLQVAEKLTIASSSSTLDQISLDLDYAFTPGFKLLADFPLKNNTSPLSAEYLIEKWSYELVSSGSLSLGFSLPYRIVSYKGSLGLTSSQREFFAPDSTITNAELLAFTKSDFDRRFLNVTQNNRIDVNPFTLIPELASSSIYYDFNYTVLKQRYQETSVSNWTVEDTWFAWQPAFISTHTLGLSLVLNSGLISSDITTSYSLPPLAETWSYGFNFSLKTSPASRDWLKTGFSGSVLSPSSDWQAQAINFLANFTILDDFYLNNTLTYTPALDKVSALNNTLKIGPLNVALESTLSQRQGYDYTRNPPDWANLDPVAILQPSKITTNLSLLITPPDLWEGRIRQEKLEFNVAYTQNLLRVTENLIFSYSLNYSIKVFEAFDFSFALTGGNRNFYRYFPGFAETIGVAPLNFLEDLWKGINIFDSEGLQETSFKLNSILVSLTHNVGDWYVKLTLNTKPLLETINGGSAYIWDSSVSLFIIWSPIEEIKKKFEIKKDVWRDVSGT